MEQKTEASQAVEEHKPCPFCGTAPRYLAKQEGIYCELVICDTCGLGLAPSSWSRRAALKAQPAPTEAPKGPLDIPEPGNTNSLADRIFRLPCNWKGDRRLSAAVEMGHAMACEQAYDLAYEHAAKAPTEATQAGAGLTRENQQTRMDATFAGGAGLAEQGALSANPNLTTSGVTCQPVAAQGNTSNNSSSSQLSGNSGELQPSGNTGELAQGWDVDDLISDMDINEEVAGMRAELQASSTIIPSILAAQGEDSARLDAERYRFIRDNVWAKYEGLHETIILQINSDWDWAIDRARASAETGGVKS